MIVVKFKNGCFGIRQGWFKRTYRYLDKTTNDFWSDEALVKHFCYFNTKQEAELRLIKFKTPYKLNTDYGTKI